MKPIFLAVLMASTSHAALAADAVFESDPVPAPVVEETRFSLTLGGGVGFQPLYEGSDEYRTVGFPIVSPSFGASDGPRRFEFRGLDDVRIHALYAGGLSVGPLLGYRFGRDQDDSRRLNGLGDIDGGLVVGGFVNYDVISEGPERLGVGLAYSTQVTGDAADGSVLPALSNDYGYEIDLSAHYETQVTDRLNVAMRAGGTYADDDYMQTHFGVDPLQAANSAAAGVGLLAYDADAGIKNVYANVSTVYQLTQNFDLRAGLGYSRLLNDAADSPVTENENQFNGFLGAAYKLQF